VKLGFNISERTVSRYLRRIPPGRGVLREWGTFLWNHREVLAAMDFFTVPTMTFRMLTVWFLIHHGRRKIVHFDITEHPTAPWVMQQLRESFPYDSGPSYLVFDRDSIFSQRVIATIQAMGIELKRTAPRSPWQNGVAERWIGNCRRELLDRVVILNERHLRRLLRDYLDYYARDRCHLALEKDVPEIRPVQPRPSARARVVAQHRVGGLHHRYTWREAA